MLLRHHTHPACWQAVISVIRFWWQRATTRRALRDLDPRQLEDTGMTEQDRARECAKWFWQ